MAVTSTFLSLFNSGDRIIISSNVYGGVPHFKQGFQKFRNRIFHRRHGGFEKTEESITPDVKAFFIESPANPLYCNKFGHSSKIAEKHHVLTIVGNTFMTPYLRRPLEFGSDIVMHSATKYLGGHSDLVEGLSVTSEKKIAERLAFTQNAADGACELAKKGRLFGDSSSEAAFSRQRKKNSLFGSSQKYRIRSSGSQRSVFQQEPVCNENPVAIGLEISEPLACYTKNLYQGIKT